MRTHLNKNRWHKNNRPNFGFRDVYKQTTVIFHLHKTHNSLPSVWQRISWACVLFINSRQITYVHGILMKRLFNVLYVIPILMCVYKCCVCITNEVSQDRITSSLIPQGHESILYIQFCTIEIDPCASWVLYLRDIQEKTVKGHLPGTFDFVYRSRDFKSLFDNCC